jgi:DNA-binding response OmpR family regulator
VRILVIEDNPKMASALGKGLREHGYTVETCARGYEGEQRAATDDYDVIILDVMLPDRDGLDVCRDLRRRKVATPILVLTALSGTAETVAGLDAGADDYLAKPFEFDELIARVRALLRRGQATQSTKLSYDDLELDLAKRTARRAGHGIKLTSKEFVLLEYFVRNPDRVLSRQSIAEKVWDINYEPSSNVIDVYVSALRRKIDREFERPLIHTIIGTGYRFGIMDEPPTAEPGA